MKDGPAQAAGAVVSDRRYIDTKKYVCGIEINDRMLMGNPIGIDDTWVKLCKRTQSNKSVDVKFMGIALREGTYAGDGNKGNASTFNTLLTKTASITGTAGYEFIIRRQCGINCDATHKDIYYKRIQNPSQIVGAEAYQTFMANFGETNNVSGTDMAIYSNLQDALDGVNSWSMCGSA